MLTFCALCRYQIPDNWPYQEARCLFKEPHVYPGSEEPELKWSSPDEEVQCRFFNFYFTSLIKKLCDNIVIFCLGFGELFSEGEWF